MTFRSAIQFWLNGRAAGQGVKLAIAGMLMAATLGTGALPPKMLAATSVLYVATNGNDSNPGTLERPFRTIDRGLEAMSPGSTLLVRGGTYVENITNPSIRPGTAASRVLVKAYPGERPVLKGLLWLKGADYWTLDGINVTWSTANGSTDHMVKMTNGVGWQYVNSELWGARSFAALLVAGTVTGQPANWVVRGNCIHDVLTNPIHHGNGDHNLYINTGTTAGPGLVERNILFNAPNGQNIKVGYGRSDPQPGDGTANLTIRYNTMYGSLKNISLADDTHHITIERNIVKASEEGYAIRAYRLTGTSNVFRSNVFHEFRKLQYADTGYRSLTDGGGNLFPLDPLFNGRGCASFKPQNIAAQPYGRYASTAPAPVTPSSFTDIADSRFIREIEWLAGTGITRGCAAHRFCPKGSVTRAQMATFLDRALKLPAATRDYFTDDNGNKHEGGINRLARAGITAGCAYRKYCPDGVVTRAQMASFLTRALRSPATARDYFTDDNGNKHEGGINRLARAGITAGCAYRKYCPDGVVTREQMAAFLYRALAP